MDMTTLEGNKMIAGFMDSNYARSMGSIINFLEKPTPFETTNSFDVTELFYHKSWDWLIPVVEKINNIYASDTPHIWYAELNQKIDSVIQLPLRTKIFDVWIEIIKFIQWYNQNSK